MTTFVRRRRYRRQGWMRPHENIVFFADNFPPESNAPAIRTLEHAREWVRAGHDVTVILLCRGATCRRHAIG